DASAHSEDRAERRQRGSAGCRQIGIGPPMQQIADWLEKLGMSEYVQRFAENRIDLSILPDLTDLHLKDLGLPLGDRLKMLRAIRELSGRGSASPQPESRSQD